MRQFGGLGTIPAATADSILGDLHLPSDLRLLPLLLVLSVDSKTFLPDDLGL